MSGGNNFTQALLDAEAGLEIIHEKIRLIHQDTLASAELISKALQASNKNTPNGAGKSLSETTAAMSELNKKVNLYIGLQKDQEKQWKRNITTANQFNSNMESINKQRERTLTLQSKSEAKLEKENRAYNKLNRALRNMKDTYRDLRVRKEMNMQLTAKEEAKMLRLEASILKVDTAMKKTDAKMGVHTRSVGNYGKAFDSLGFSVAQITRESPAFINSMQTGFMAISNNIPTLVDEIDKLKYANQQARIDGVKGVPIWKSLGKAIFSYQTAISAAILLLTVAGPSIIKWIDKVTKTAKATDGATASQKAFNETLREGGAEAETTTQQFEILNKALTNGQLTRDQQLKTAMKMKELYPDILQDMSAEEIVSKGIGDNYEKITKEIARNAAMKAVSNRMTEIASEKLKAQIEMEEANTKAVAIRMAMDSEVGADWLHIQARKLWLMGDEADALITSAEKQSELNKLEKEQERIGKFINENIVDYIKLTTESIDLEKEKSEKVKTYQLFTINHYKDLISLNEKRIANELTVEDSEEIKYLRELNAGYQKQIDLLGGVAKKKKEEVVYLEGSIGAYEKLITANNKLLKHADSDAMYQKITEENEALKFQIEIIQGIAREWEDLELIADAKGAAAIDKFMNKMGAGFNDYFKAGNPLISLDDIIEEPDVEFDNWFDGFKPMFDQVGDRWGILTKLLGKDTAQLEVDFENMYIAMGGDPKDQEKMAKAFGKFIAGEEEKVAQLLTQIGDTVNAAADLGTALIEQNIEKLEQEKTAIEERYDMEMLKAEEMALSKEQLADKQIILEKQKAKDLREIQDKINKEKKKQAIIDKAAAIATIAINTAIGVSAAITKGAVFNSAEVILTLAVGALQTAAVLATPIPQYAEGTENHKGGKAMIGDGGKHEAVITPDGSIFKSPKTDTIVDLPAGTIVKPDYDKFMSGTTESQKQLYDSRLLRGLAMNAIQEKRDDRVLEAIKTQTEVLKKKKLSSTMINKQQDVATELWKLKQTSW